MRFKSSSLLLRAGTATAAVLLAATAVAVHGGASKLAQWASAIVRPDETNADGSQTLPNGWRIRPAGTPISLPGDMPLTMLVSKDGKYLVVNTGGFHDHSVNVIDTGTRKCVQSVNVGTDWTGMCFSDDGKELFVSGGGAKRPRRKAADTDTAESRAILRFAFADGRLTAEPSLSLAGAGPLQTYVSGLACGADGRLYAANIKTDQISLFDPADPAQAPITASAGRAPYGVALSPDGGTLAVSDWAEDAVRLLDAKTLAQTASIPVGSRPNQLVYSPDGRLFVANSGSNSVSVISRGAVVETIKTSLDPRDLVGSTPDALVLDPHGERLYAANADNNDIAVIDTADPKESRVLGFIPTGWYPSALAISSNGRQLFVGTAKGLGFRGSASGKPNLAEDLARQRQKFTYIGDLLSGDVCVVDLPDASGLAADTRQVLADVPHPPAPTPAEEAANPFRNIKHVVYIIRENRTYDQVFGDIPGGNGDPNLCLFGENVTPNAHLLARNYVLLDNLYCNGEVSQDGHQWCDAAYATDYTEKDWILGYSGQTGPPDDDDLAASPAGYLWDNCARHGVTYRTYGEGARFRADRNGPPVFLGDKTLDGHTSYPYSQIPPFSKGRDLGRAQVFIDDLHAAEKTGDWPQFMVMSLGEDHTQGLTAGAFTPTAHVAENDQAVGQIVDAVSHSRFWPETAIFIIEDDAQNGPDHVDAHRTVGLVASPYVHAGVDSTMYTTASYVRTIELILGLPPMTQFDAHATPMYAAFTDRPNLAAYNCLAAQVDLEARNPLKGKDEEASDKLDLTAPDRADPDKLNAILWHALKPGVPMPAPTRSVWQREAAVPQWTGR